MTTTHNLLLISLITLSLFSISCESGDVILQPSSDKQGSPAILVFIQGASLTTDSYIPLMKAIQDAAEFPLWIGIPEFLLNLPDPLVMTSTIGAIAQNISDSIGKKITEIPFFFGGHSLGGATVHQWVPSNLNDYPLTSGVILYGSFLVRSVRDGYKIPTLTVGGELDGLCRVTRIAEAFFIAQKRSDSDKFPVVVVPGMSHMQFSSGTPPTFVQLNDLLPEISYDDAYSATSQVTIDFINQRLNLGSPAVLPKMIQQSSDFFAPINNALQLEGFYHFNPPCYQSPDDPNCISKNPWTEQVSAKAMYKLDKYGVAISNSDELREVWMLPPHLPHFNNNCTPNSGCTLQSTSVTENVYDTLDSQDTGLTHTSAFSLKTKFKSRQAALEAIGINVDWNTSDYSVNACAEVNQLAWQYALDNAGEVTKARFDKWGVPMVMGPDDQVSEVGPIWIWTFMKYDQEEVNGVVSLVVTSVSMTTATDIFPEAAAGMHYCKVLSPARAIEWIYIDTLRLRRSLVSPSTSKQ